MGPGPAAAVLGKEQVPIPVIPVIPVIPGTRLRRAQSPPVLSPLGAPGAGDRPSGPGGPFFTPGPALGPPHWEPRSGTPAPPPLPGDPVTARPGPAVPHRSPGKAPAGTEGNAGAAGLCGPGDPNCGWREEWGSQTRIGVPTGEGGAGMWNGGSQMGLEG